MPVQAIQSFQEFQDIINGDRPAVIDFWAIWCGPCRVIGPVLENLSDDPEYEGVSFYKVDVDDQAEIGQEVGIRAMPTFAVFQKGTKIDELVGADPNRLKALCDGAARSQ